ncbi:MAG: ABC transporter ATP-binding protein [Chloroflexi bacterium]|nr:ABC transporter ATP-binding protein [Chloroflexota bacterium]
MMRGGGGTWPGGSFSSGTTSAGSLFGRAGSATLGSAGGGSWKDLWRALSFLRGQRKWVIGGYVAWLVANLLDLAIPLQIKRAIDDGITGQNLQVLVAAVLAVFGLFAGKSAINWIYLWTFHAYEADAARDLRNSVYRGLQRLSFGYLDRSDTGQLIARATADVDAVQSFMGHGQTGLVTSIGTYVLTLAVAFFVSWQLTLLALVTVPLLLWAGVSYSRVSGPLFARVQQQYGSLTGLLQENLSGVRVVKAFTQEENEVAKYTRAADELQNRSLTLARTLASRGPLLMCLAGAGNIFVIVAGGHLVTAGALTIGTLIAFLSYLNKLYGPTRRIGFLVSQFSRATASAHRIFEVLDTIPEVRDRPGAVDLPAVRGEVTFENVSFEFRPGIPVLKNVNLTAKPGQVIALVGGTGSGKSALTGLIPRFYDVSAGRVLVDGHDVRDVTLASLRRHVAIVPQDSFLFSRSVKENIQFGRPDSQISLVQFAAERAQAHRFIERLPERYNTEVGDRGVTLSGGQRQRTALARAILVEPTILILDDATSSVDMETEHLIEQALEDVMKGRTTFVIAHRLSTVKRADEVVVLDRGEIVERGTHDALIQRQGHYRRIYDVQMRDQEEFIAARAGLVAGGSEFRVPKASAKCKVQSDDAYESHRGFGLGTRNSEPGTRNSELGTLRNDR